jgi:hypothetical protein
MDSLNEVGLDDGEFLRLGTLALGGLGLPPDPRLT